ncbi:hypothetical protein [Streptomyces sp. NPDC006368]|uniref:hypothetical protein n=1 Tax=Streptomyces sp. NPDC006368 TaxID=3156760 RepID=UPI0033A052EE
MRRVVRGFWGPREESPEVLARRWQVTLRRIAELLPAAGAEAGAPRAEDAWGWQHVRASGPATELRADEASLLAALRAQRETDAWSGGHGYGLRLVTTGAQGWRIEVSGLAGGTPEFLLQSMVIGVTAPDGADIPDAALLTAIAEEWEPDFGDVSDDDVLDVLEDEGGFGVGEPLVGWVGYLSAARAALVPDDVAAARKELRGGGVLLDIAAPDDTDGVLRACLRLRDAGALQPLPRPMSRAVL